jgi:hypothetical protein
MKVTVEFHKASLFSSIPQYSADVPRKEAQTYFLKEGGVTNESSGDQSEFK